MAKISEALTYGLTIRESATDGSDFTNPATDYRRLFLGEDGQLHVKDSAGAVTDIGGAGTDVATDAIWTTAGKVAVATGTATATEQWPPGHEFDYKEATAAVTGITAATEAGGDTVITGNAVSLDGSTVVYVEFFSPHAEQTVGTDDLILLTLWDGGTDLGDITQSGGAGTVSIPIFGKRRLTPSNGSHTYTIKAWVTGGGTFSVGAGAAGTGNYVPMFLRVVKA